MRIQFYPDSLLESRLISDAQALGTNVGTLVADILKNYYGLDSALNGVALRNKVFDEAADFVKKHSKGTSFDLNAASPTYRGISMTGQGRPSPEKASIGKEFNRRYVGKIPPFINVRQVMKNGKPVRSVGNRAAMYEIF